MADSFWLALNAHVPLINVLGRENWRPASRPVAVFAAALPSSWVPRYDTWAALMRVFSWITVPIIIAAVTGLLRHRPVESDSEPSE